MPSPDGCCSEELLQQYLAGQISPLDLKRVSTHLIECNNCRIRLNELSSSMTPPSTKIDTDEGTSQSSTAVFDGQNEDKSSDIQFSAPYVRLMQLVGNFDAKADKEKIGQYELREVIGRGGMGVVIKAFDTRLNRDVAIKILAPELSASSKARRRFEREARSAAAINHPNIVTIFEINQVEGLPFLVMEYLKGGDLWQRLKRTPPLTLVQILQISLQVAEALVAAHKVGVVHRDVKPANILLEEGVDRIKLTDFGLATATEDRSILTSKRDTVGTPAYLAPEIIRGDQASVQSDLFSFGCVIYSLVTGHSPFRGSNPIEVINKIANLEQKPLHELDPSIPKTVSEIVQKLLKKDVRRRYQSAKEVRDDLQTQLAVVNSLSTDAITGLRHFSSPSKQPKRTLSKSVGVAAAFLAIALGVAGWMVFGPNHRGRGEAGTKVATPETTDPSTGATRSNQRLTLSVASDGSTSYPTIAAALAAAKPNSTIEIIDDSSYEGTIEISDTDRLAGLTLQSRSKGHGTIHSRAGKGSVIVVKNTPNVTIRNLNLAATDGQHCVLLEGNCAGLVLDKLNCHQSPESNSASIVFWFGARGEPNRPVVLRDIEFQFGALGVVVIGAGDQPSTSIRIEGCRFQSEAQLAHDFPAAAITLEKPVEDLVVTGNTFFSGPDGIRFRSMSPNVGKNIAITNNTFLKLRRWISFEMASFEQQQIRIDMNLILETPGSELEPEALASMNHWFQENWRESFGESLDDPAKTVANVNLLSRDPSSTSFLVPAEGLILDRKTGNLIGAVKADGSKIIAK